MLVRDKTVFIIYIIIINIIITAITIVIINISDFKGNIASNICNTKNNVFNILYTRIFNI